MRRIPPNRLRIVVALSVTIALTILMAVVRREVYARTVLWSALMVASFVGWGSLVNLWLAPRRWADWGLRAGWGMALYLLMGGYVCLAHLAVRRVLITQVAFGVVALLVTWVVRGPPRAAFASFRRRVTVWVARAGVFAIVVGAYGVATLTFFGYINHRFNNADDQALYFTFAQKLVQIGSLFEPFAARRIVTLGGKAYLDASFISVGSIYYLHAVDTGISLLLVVALLVGQVGRSALKEWHAVPLALALFLLFTLANAHANTGSLMSAVVVILTLYRTVRIPFGPEPDRPTWPMESRRVAVLAVLAAVSIVLRTSNAAAVLPFVVLVSASDFVLATRRPWSPEALLSLGRVASLFVAVFVFALLPWSVLLKQSCGTLFYPFGHGNLTPGWTFLKAATKWDEVAHSFLTHVFYVVPITVFLPFAIVGLVPLVGRARNVLVALTLATLIGLLTLSFSAVAFTDPWDTCRYYYAYVVTMSLVAAASVGRAGGRAALVAGAIAVHFAGNREELKRYYDDLVAKARAAYNERKTGSVEFDAPTGDYRDVQSYIPSGATVAAAVFEGFRFDFERNAVFALDVIGGMGPKPGWPAHLGPQALGDYLKANGVQYLVWADFNLPNTLYSRAHWQSLLADTNSYLAGEGELQLDAEDAIEKLSAMRHVVYRAHAMTVVDLSAGPP